jgi:hypothetical protein
VLSGGAVRLVSGALVSVNASTTGLRTVMMTASGGSILMSSGSGVTTPNANIRLQARDDVTVTGIKAGTGNVALIADSGTVRGVDPTSPDVRAAGLSLSSGGGPLAVGTGAGAVQALVTTLAAHAAQGGIGIHDSRAILIGSVATPVNQVAADGTVSILADPGATQTGLLAEQGGSVVLTTSGGVSVATGGNVDGVVAAGGGNILIQSSGAAGSVAIAGKVRTTGAGSITILSGNAIAESTGTVQAGGSGTIMATAARSLLVADGATVVSAGGTIRLRAGTDLTVTSGTSMRVWPGK